MNLKDTILGEIKRGNVAMTPRVYFTLKLLALVAVSMGVLLSSVFIFNFLFFSIRLSGNAALLHFGPRGIWPFLFFFPWPLLMLDIAFVAALQWLLRQFRFGYHIPILYLAGALILGAFGIGYALDRVTPLNDRLHEGREHLPPPFGRLYEGGHRPGKGSGICRCEILSIEGATLIVEDTRDATSTLTVVLPDDDRHATTSGLKVGDIVFIAGKEEDGRITAFGVRKEGDEPPRHAWPFKKE